jgi:hypothetical protein
MEVTLKSLRFLLLGIAVLGVAGCAWERDRGGGRGPAGYHEERGPHHDEGDRRYDDWR